MQVPCRSEDCLHIQCFDASVFLKINASKDVNTWKCPICNSKASFDNLIFDGFFHQILQSKNVSENTQEIVVFSNASWEVCSSNVAKIEEIDLTMEADLPLRVRHPPMEINQPKRMLKTNFAMQPYVKIKRLTKLQLKHLMCPVSQSEGEDSDNVLEIDLTASPLPPEESEIDEHEIPNLSEDEDSNEFEFDLSSTTLARVTADEDLDEIFVKEDIITKVFLSAKY